jgi:hypothetical protein
MTLWPMAAVEPSFKPLQPRRWPRLLRRLRPTAASFIYTSGVLPEKARLDVAGAIKVNLRETTGQPRDWHTPDPSNRHPLD